MKARIHK